MTDRPILFSAPMVRALLDGRKTQTRRILTLPKWSTQNMEHVEIDDDGSPITIATESGCLSAVPVRFAKGGRLWVREAWRDEHPIAIQEGRYSQEGRAGIPGPPGVTYRTIYRADGEPLQAWRRADGEHPYFTLDGPADDVAARHPSICSTFDLADGRGARWASARYMPRWASRLTLTVTDVRVQRLQEISKADAIAEGIQVGAPLPEVPDSKGDIYHDGVTDPIDGWTRNPVTAYANLWDYINGAGAWAANPWIVALTFTVERRNIDAARAA